MASVAQLNSYECDQCGTTNIVAAPVVYQQGTRTYSGRFNSGTSQSYSAQAASSPSPRGYGRPLLVWGVPICFTFFWGFAGLGRILGHPKSAATLTDAVAILLLLGVVCVGGMVLSFSQDCPLQPGSLSWAALELGAYLHLPAMREAPFDPLIGAIRHSLPKAE